MKAKLIQLMRFSIESSASLYSEAVPFELFANIFLANKSEGFASLIYAAPFRNGRVNADLCLPPPCGEARDWRGTRQNGWG